MAKTPPTPVCKGFVVCRQIFIDEVRQDCVLVSPIHQVFLPRFPADEELCVFARWTNAHGRYEVVVQLRELDGEVVWRRVMSNPFDMPDPLFVVPVRLQHLAFHFPHPGKYEVALLANREGVAADVFWAHPIRPADP